MVRFTKDGTMFEHVAVIDAGSSAKFKGDPQLTVHAAWDVCKVRASVLDSAHALSTA